MSKDFEIDSDSSDSSYSKLEFDDAPNIIPEQYKDKVNKLNKILQSEEKDIDELRNLARSDGGLVTSLIRKEAWQLFLDIQNENKPLLDIEAIANHSKYHLVNMDVKSCLKRFLLNTYEEKVILHKKSMQVILSIISENSDLKYYQGYHDMVLTFLIEVGQEKTYSIMKYLSLNHLRDFLMPTLEQTLYLLWHVILLISKLNPDLEQFITQSGIHPLFALPWLTSWFSHNLNQHTKIVRLFDYFLASPRDIIIYVIAHLINARSDEILKVKCDVISVFSVITKIPDDLDFELLLTKATDMYNECPISSLKDEVDMRIQYEADLLCGYQEFRSKRKTSRFVDPIARSKFVGCDMPTANAVHDIHIGWLTRIRRYHLLIFIFSISAALWTIMTADD